MVQYPFCVGSIYSHRGTVPICQKDHDYVCFLGPLVRTEPVHVPCRSVPLT